MIRIFHADFLDSEVSFMENNAACPIPLSKALFPPCFVKVVRRGVDRSPRSFNAFDKAKSQDVALTVKQKPL